MLFVPAAAAAATRYATPSPAAGADCSAAEPCSLSTALSGAASGDTVVVGAGTYGSSSAPFGPLSDGGNELTIEGAVTGAGRPVVYVNQPSIGETGDFTLSGNGSTIQDLDLEALPEEPGLDLTGDNETAARMRVILAAGGFGDACEVAPSVSNATILNSVCVNHNPDFYSGASVQSGSTATLRNDTFVGADYGLYVQGTATVVNSILQGPSGDLYNDQSTISMTDCEFSSLAESGPSSSTGQVTAAPVFVDAATDNYHTTATSPGVDKGENDAANGSLDLDGDVRELGSATDIGAYEVSPSASVTTGSASAITTSQAMVAGSIDPDDAAVQYHFEYGTSAGSYLSSTTVITVAEQTTAETPTATLIGLTPSTTYHYQLVAEIDGTEYDGGDQQFTTATPPPPHNTTAPAITGTPKAGSLLTCSPGTWSGSPTRYEYQWSRDGTPIQGATGATYTVGTSDEGTTLVCAVTAIGPGGTGGPATSNSVTIAVPVVPRCPAATGSIHGASIGLVHLGMTRAQSQHAYSHSSSRGNRYKDFFCLTPHGVRVGYASPKLLKGLPKSAARKLAGRVVWISTDNFGYAVKGVRAGATLSAAERSLPHGYLFRVGQNNWYLARAGSATGVLKVRNNLVQEVGIADRSLTGSHKADRHLMTSFD
jgi:hypothetical protein